ncbi:MBL fold metallo-hydrolase [Paenibacillus caui]|uniref:MBL fold metallo-hydrolase n=1 Tax=Paenibacillus caui TaxID=2873927 RepID=UPI001CA8240A|nr:MBL fold metallo-hydrolase [Paenibacillus caui]
MINKVQIFYAGYCIHPECMVIKHGQFRKAKFPALFALLEHDKYGSILFDTGYTKRFFSETERFPFNIYSKLTPVVLEDGISAKEILESEGIHASSINYVIISHFHADHIGGLKDFKSAQFVFNSDSYDAVKDKRGISALRSGFLRGLLPENFEERAMPLTDTMKMDISEAAAPFETGYDLFGDKSIILVKLPGHAIGQIGALVTDRDHHEYFFVADAAWRSDAYRQFRPPNPIAYMIIDQRKEYIETLGKLNKLYLRRPELQIIPSHCMEAFGEKIWIT